MTTLLNRKSQLRVLLIFGLLHAASHEIANAQIESGGASAFKWSTVEAGFQRGVFVAESSAMVRPEVQFLKFDPAKFSFNVITADSLGSRQSDIKRMTRSVGGIAGINSNYFDEQGAALGLVISDGKQQQKIHRGGSTLTGIFFIDNKVPHIVHRDESLPRGVLTAFQAGPRLIVNGKAVELSSQHQTSRRSGVAITNRGELLVFATLYRFPGLSLAALQEILLEPIFGVVEALNLDGGGSSQIFVEKSGAEFAELFIMEDAVPVGLVVKRRK